MLNPVIYDFIETLVKSVDKYIFLLRIKNY